MIGTTVVWIENHPGTAAWLQALGSLIAIGIAIWVPYRQRALAHRDAKAEHLIKARGILLQLYPELWTCEEQVKRAKKLLAGQPSATGVVPTPYAVMTNVRIDVPQLLRDQADNLYLFGDPASFTLQHLVGVLSQFQMLKSDVESSAALNPNITLEDVRGRVEGDIQLIEKLLFNAREQLKPFDTLRPGGSMSRYAPDAHN